MIKKARQQGKTGAQRSSTTWKPGQSGNPDGRSKAEHAFRKELAAELASAYPLDKIIKHLNEILAKAAANIRLEAVKFIVERIYGKPSQEIRLEGDLVEQVSRGLTNMSDEDFKRLGEELKIDTDKD